MQLESTRLNSLRIGPSGSQPLEVRGTAFQAKLAYFWECSVDFNISQIAQQISKLGKTVSEEYIAGLCLCADIYWNSLSLARDKHSLLRKPLLQTIQNWLLLALELSQNNESKAAILSRLTTCVLASSSIGCSCSRANSCQWQNQDCITVFEKLSDEQFNTVVSYVQMTLNLHKNGHVHTLQRLVFMVYVRCGVTDVAWGLLKTVMEQVGYKSDDSIAPWFVRLHDREHHIMIQHVVDDAIQCLTSPSGRSATVLVSAAKYVKDFCVFYVRWCESSQSDALKYDISKLAKMARQQYLDDDDDLRPHQAMYY
jgi:hypothetical protein